MDNTQNPNGTTNNTQNHNTHSPRRSDAADNSPRSSSTRRGSTRTAISSPWNQVVRGESEPIPAVTLSHPPPPPATEPAPAGSSLSSSSNPVIEEINGDNGSVSAPNGNAGRRTVWNRQSNAPVTGSEVAAAVMDADSWPALTDSVKSSSDGSASVSGSGPALSASVPSSSQKVASSSVSAIANTATNHPMPTRQRSMRQRYSGSLSSNGGLHQTQVTHGPSQDMQSHNSSPRDQNQRAGHVSQSHGGSEHPQYQRNSSRSRNGGSYSRGDGSHSQNYGIRRDHDRGNQEWNNHRFNNNRDSHTHQQRRYMRPSPPPGPPPIPYMAPQPGRTYGGPLGFPELASPVYYIPVAAPQDFRGMPFIPPMQPHMAYFPPPDSPNLELQTKIVSQIDYYFSNDNLVKDTYLRQNMDDQGWVSIDLIAKFNRIMNLRADRQQILDAVRNSAVVEVQGDKIRKRNDWMKWIMTAPASSLNVSSPGASGSSNIDSLAAGVGAVSLDGEAINHGNTTG